MARKYANQYKGIFQFLEQNVCTLLAMFFLVERDYYRDEYCCHKDTLIGIRMVALYVFYFQ